MLEVTLENNRFAIGQETDGHCLYNSASTAMPMMLETPGQVERCKRDSQVHIR